MRRVLVLLLGVLAIAGAVGAAVALDPAPARGAAPPADFQPGAPGLGDPYFPLDGNGGYDVENYLLDITYDPATGVLGGVATIRAKATQDLSSFNLDFAGLTVESIQVNGRSAAWARDGSELIVTPSAGLRTGWHFKVVVRYNGIPEPTFDPLLGLSGFIATDDGAVVAGQPHGAASWFPVNDHPLDKAAYTFRITVPEGLEAVANGILQSTQTAGGWTTWTWNAKEPMASYLATATIGEFDLRSYRNRGIRFWDAIDPDLFVGPTPRTGAQFAISQQGEPSYKRLARVLSVPASGATVSFAITRETEPGWDFVFVEAHTVGEDDWTTLPDLNGHTSQDTGFSCPFWHGLHPFLTHYQTDNGDGTCSPAGSSGSWWAASGPSGGWEEWTVDLSPFADRDVVVSISYASDDFSQWQGAFVDDIVVSTGEGTTSFEDDGDTLDGWTMPGAPADSPPNPNDWIDGAAADAPPPIGASVEASFARQGEIIDFLSSLFGTYPFSAAGGIVDDVEGLGFALETQTRPIYTKDFFRSNVPADGVVVHELAHQWYGDSLSVAAWQHIWLNEGFATYAEWLWSEREGFASAQQIFDDFYFGIPDDNPFWQVTIGDPGPDLVLDITVYWRGAMTLHQLRLAVGDAAFFQILRQWAKTRAGGNVTTDEFVALAEQISGQELGELFQTWLFTPGKPVVAGRATAAAAMQQPAGARPWAALWERLGLKP
jgi:hypothetical protein